MAKLAVAQSLAKRPTSGCDIFYALLALSGHDVPDRICSRVESRDDASSIAIDEIDTMPCLDLGWEGSETTRVHHPSFCGGHLAFRCARAATQENGSRSGVSVAVAVALVLVAAGVASADPYKWCARQQQRWH